MSFFWSREARAAGLYRRAEQQRRLGQLDRAATTYRKIIEAGLHPFDALHGLGLVLLEQGQLDEALAQLAAALALKGGHAGARADHGRALALSGRPDEALAAYDAALAQRADLAAAHAGRGQALRALGRPAEALAADEAALRLEPGLAAAHNGRGLALLTLGRPAEALEAFDRALRRNGEGPTPLDRARTFNSRGAALRALGRPADALVSLDKALAVQSTLVEALHNRGAVLRDLGRPAEALAAFERLLALNPARADAHCNRGILLADLDRADEALAAYARALEIDPGCADALGGRGVLLTELGRLDKAVAAFEQGIALAPAHTRLYFNLTQAKRMGRGDKALAAMERLARGAEALDANARIDLDFALAKALGDIGDVRGAVHHMASGNAAKRALTGYDEVATLRVLERLGAAYPPQVMAVNAGAGDPSALPVFILGMPRSGTTLVEQILASHPRVHAAGESDAFAQAMAGLNGLAIKSPESLAQMPADRWRQLGAGYVRRITEGAPAALRITNKTPENFRIAGLIHLALPNARIVHVRREAAATCFSCYATLFAGALPYAYDQAELGRFHRAYEALMDHWRAVIPPAAMLEVRYEDVVADLEGQARRILDHCGLSWDARCLEFQKTERLIRTASAHQVRQPLYPTSVDRWKAYQPHLGPLLSALGR